MAAVTPPITTLPGTHYPVPAGMTCDDHPNIPAAVRIQGETDSFGCEMIDMCTDCFTRYQQQANQHSGTCDWCKTHAEHLRARRDMDEGTHGPVYYVCTPCVVADNKRINDERDNEHNDDFFDED